MLIKTIEASFITHRNERRIRIRFDPDAAIARLIKQISGSRWSKSLKAWHIPLSKSLYADFKKQIPQGWQLIEIKYGEESLALIKAAPVAPEQLLPVPVQIKSLPVKLSWAICPENQEAMRLFLEKLVLKAYSGSTIRTYRHEFGALLQKLKGLFVGNLTSDQVKRYILYCINIQQLSENTVHSRLNALKFYFEQVLGRDKIFVEIPRPKKRIILPKVLGEQEIGRLFRALANKKHKAILFTAYSAGLRVSEAVNLKISDIDSDRMQLFVERAKGKKDRYVMLSPVLLDILRNYIKSSKPRPVKYLFEGIIPGEALSMRTAQQIFVDARIKAGIKKQVSFHSLRHSFATHLLEKGVDIKYIKELLGHFDIRTTMRYLHVKREMLVNIRSPLDDLYNQGGIDI